MSRKSYYTDCPRCGSHSFERLNSYAHCSNCLHFEDYYEDAETCYAAVRSLEISHMNPTEKNENDETLESESLVS